MRRARIRLGWSQRELAERAGLSRTHVGRLELGQSAVEESVHGRLVAALGFESGDALLLGAGRAGKRPHGRAGAPTHARQAAAPFTLGHFREWASRLITDGGERLSLDPWQLLFFADVFSGVPEAWLVVGEGQGKSTMIAALVLYHLRYRPTAWVPIAAASREQAEVVWKQAEGFVLRTPELREDYVCLAGVRRIRCPRMGSEARVFASDVATADGTIPTLAICDELHRHKDLGLYSTFRGKLDKRSGQIVALSTAGEPGSDFEQMREAIRQGATAERNGCFARVVSSQLALHEYAVPEGGDVEDLALVKAANPFSRITVEQLRRKRSSPTMTLPYWRRYVCGLPTRSEHAAITEAEWAAARTDERIPEGQPIWCGLDVAWKHDCTALVPYWQPRPDHRLFGPPVVLVPPRDGNSLDPNLIERALLRIHARNPIHTVVADPSRAEQLCEWIRQTLGAKVIERKTSNAYAEVDYARWVEALSNGYLKHPGDPTFTRHVLQAVARITPYGATRFDRSSSSRLGDQDNRVIDALSAAAAVHAQAQEQAPPVAQLPRWRLLA